MSFHLITSFNVCQYVALWWKRLFPPGKLIISFLSFCFWYYWSQLRVCSIIMKRKIIILDHVALTAKGLVSIIQLSIWEHVGNMFRLINWFYITYNFIKFKSRSLLIRYEQPQTGMVYHRPQFIDVHPYL